MIFLQMMNLKKLQKEHRKVIHSPKVDISLGLLYNGIITSKEI